MNIEKMMTEVAEEIKDVKMEVEHADSKRKATKDESAAKEYISSCMILTQLKAVFNALENLEEAMEETLWRL